MSNGKTDEYTMIEEKVAEMLPLFSRMDIDRELYFLRDYKMMTPDGTEEMSDVINVTFNDANTFGLRAVATLGGAIRQPVVQGRKMKEKECTKIEEFIDDITFDIDDRLALRGIPSLDAFLNEQICIRGSIGARSTLRQKKGVFVPDVLPIDTRFLPYEMGVDGLRWVAPVYTRSKRSLKDEYGYDTQETELELIDFWNDANNLIFIEQKQEKKTKNPYGYPPFVIVQSATGSMLADKEAYSHRGESIFWSNRGLFPEMHRTASILQTLNVASFAGSLQYESSAGLKATKPKKAPFGVRTVMPIERGMGYKPMPINDIRNATRLFYAILYTRIQQGGLSAIDYGNLTFPLSAVAIARLTASREQIFLPRLQAKAIFYQQLFKMIIRQYQKLGIPVRLGREGEKRDYSPSDLDGDYEICFRFFSESREQQIANYSVAAAAERFLSSYTIRRNILQVRDPDAEDERFSAQQAERVDPAIFFYNRAKKFIAQGKDIEARIAANKMVQILRARKFAEAAPPTETPKELKPGGGGQIIPLLGGGKGAGGIIPQVGSEEEELAKAEREEEGIAAKGAEAKQEETK